MTYPEVSKDDNRLRSPYVLSQGGGGILSDALSKEDASVDEACCAAFAPGRLWSLWEMHEIKGTAIYGVISLLTHIDTVNAQVARDDSRKDQFDDEMTEKDRETVNGLIKSMVEGLSSLGIPLSLVSARRMEEALSVQCTYGEFAKHVTELRGRIRDELDSIIFYVLDPKLAAYYSPKHPYFGNEVFDQFLDAVFDIDEAGKCMALRRYTACVMHLMRALEPALQCLAAKFGVPFDRQNWNTILDKIESETRGLPAGEEKQFYSEVATHFRFIKDAWRNHAMHARDKYDQERAESIFANVRDLMKLLASRLSEASA